MQGTQSLKFVLGKQEEMRREVSNERLAARTNRQEPRRTEARRVFGLRLSLA